MKTIDYSGLSPDQIEYISSLEKQTKELEKTVESQQIRIEQLIDLINKFQKTMFGQSSEKRRYVFGEDNGQISLFNEAEVEAKKQSRRAFCANHCFILYQETQAHQRGTSRVGSCGGGCL